MFRGAVIRLIQNYILFFGLEDFYTVFMHTQSGV